MKAARIITADTAYYFCDRTAEQLAEESVEFKFRGAENADSRRVPVAIKTRGAQYKICQLMDC